MKPIFSCAVAAVTLVTLVSARAARADDAAEPSQDPVARFATAASEGDVEAEVCGLHPQVVLGGRTRPVAVAYFDTSGAEWACLEPSTPGALHITVRTSGIDLVLTPAPAASDYEPTREELEGVLQVVGTELQARADARAKERAPPRTAFVPAASNALDVPPSEKPPCHCGLLVAGSITLGAGALAIFGGVGLSNSGGYSGVNSGLGGTMVALGVMAAIAGTPLFFVGLGIHAKAKKAAQAQLGVGPGQITLSGRF